MYELQQLPYDRDGLEPYMSRETLDYHYGQHHASYVKKLNELIKGTPYEKETDLEEIIRHAQGPLYNNAAQVWNHDFFWKSMAPEGTGKPQGELAKAINRSFDSFDKFKEAFKQKAVSLFGSGWVWLVTDMSGELSIMQTQNADNPLTKKGVLPLLACDVWEHAYYIDKRNQRAAYLDEFWDLVNWKFVEKNYEKRKEKGKTTNCCGCSKS